MFPNSRPQFFLTPLKFYSILITVIKYLPDNLSKGLATSIETALGDLRLIVQYFFVTAFENPMKMALPVVPFADILCLFKNIFFSRTSQTLTQMLP